MNVFKPSNWSLQPREDPIEHNLRADKAHEHPHVRVSLGLKGTLGPRPPNEEPRASFQSWTTGLQAPGLSHSSFVRVVPFWLEWR